MIEMVETGSSFIVSIGYDITRKMMFVEFKSGSIFAYKRIPKAIHNGLIAASSKGNFFNNNVRNVYKGVRLPPSDKSKFVKVSPAQAGEIIN